MNKRAKLFFGAALCVAMTSSIFGAGAADLDILKDIIAAADLRGQVSAADGRKQYYVVSLPTMIPNLAGKSDLDIKTFEFLEVVPRNNATEWQGGAKLTEQLSKIASSIKVGRRKPTAAQSAELKKAKELLYGIAGMASNDYKVYLNYEKNYKDVTKRVDEARNDAARALAQSDLSQIEREWTLFGKRHEIDAALAIVEAFDVRTMRRAVEEWTSAIAKAQLGDYSQVYQSLTKPSGWRTISYSIDREVNIAIDHKTGQREIFSITCRVVSLRISVPDIQRGVLLSPFTFSRLWTATNALVLSDGDDSNDSEKEILPRISTGVILAKSIEFQFDDLKLWQRLRDAVEEGESTSVAGFTVGGSFIAPNFVAIEHPFVIGVRILSLPRIPNPEPDLEIE